MNVSVLQQVGKGFKGNQPHLRLQIRVFGPQAAQGLGQKVHLHLIVTADAQRQADLLFRLVQPGPGRTGQVQNAVRRGQELGARRRQLHIAAGAHKQLRAQLRLQRRDLVADCRLADAHGLGRFGEV